MEWMACAVYMYNIYMDIVVHVTFHWKKKLLSPGFELAISGLAMESLKTTLTHHTTKTFVN